MKKKRIIFVGFLVLIVSLCLYGYFSNNDSDADNVIRFNEFIKTDVIENNSKNIQYIIDTFTWAEIQDSGVVPQNV